VNVRTTWVTSVPIFSAKGQKSVLKLGLRCSTRTAA